MNKLIEIRIEEALDVICPPRDESLCFLCCKPKILPTSSMLCLACIGTEENDERQTAMHQREPDALPEAL